MYTYLPKTALVAFFPRQPTLFNNYLRTTRNPHPRKSVTLYTEGVDYDVDPAFVWGGVG